MGIGSPTRARHGVSVVETTGLLACLVDVGRDAPEEAMAETVWDKVHNAGGRGNARARKVGSSYSGS